MSAPDPHQEALGAAEAAYILILSDIKKNHRQALEAAIDAYSLATPQGEAPTPPPAVDAEKLVEAVAHAIATELYEWDDISPREKDAYRETARKVLSIPEFSRLSTLRAPSSQGAAPDWTDPGHRLTETELDVVEKAYVESWKIRRTDHGSTRAGLEAAVRAFLAHNRSEAPQGDRPMKLRAEVEGASSGVERTAQITIERLTGKYDILSTYPTQHGEFAEEIAYRINAFEKDGK